jgi:hypothetical protein
MSRKPFSVTRATSRTRGPICRVKDLSFIGLFFLTSYKMHGHAWL